MPRIAAKTFCPSTLSLPRAGKDCSNKSIAIEILIIAASRLPILGSGVLIGELIGGAEASDIVAPPSAAGGKPPGVAESFWL